MKTKVDISLKSKVYDCLYDDGGEEEGNGKGLGKELPRGGISSRQQQQQQREVERVKDRIG